MAGMGASGGWSMDTTVQQGANPGSYDINVTDPYGNVKTMVSRGMMGKNPATQMSLKTQALQNKGIKQQLDAQKQLMDMLLGTGGGGGFMQNILGGVAGMFPGGGTPVQPGFPDTGVGPGFNIPGMPGYGTSQPGFPEFGPTGGYGSTPPGDPSLGAPITAHSGASQPGFREDQPGDPSLGMPITQHGGGGISAVPGMQPYGQGRRNQLAEDFNNLAKSAQTMLVQRGFGGSSAVPDTFAEIGKQKNLSMNELEDSLFREQLQFRAAERAPMFSILQSLLGGIF